MKIVGDHLDLVWLRYPIETQSNATAINLVAEVLFLRAAPITVATHSTTHTSEKILCALGDEGPGRVNAAR
jgi:hypothetical protein